MLLFYNYSIFKKLIRSFSKWRIPRHWHKQERKILHSNDKDYRTKNQNTVQLEYFCRDQGENDPKTFLKKTKIFQVLKEKTFIVS